MAEHYPRPLSERQPEFRLLWERTFPHDLTYDEVIELELTSGLKMYHWREPEEYTLGSRILASEEGHDPALTYLRVDRGNNETPGVTFKLISHIPTDTIARWQDDLAILNDVLDYLEGQRASLS